MNRIKRVNIWVIAFVVFLPISTFGQRSILLQSDEQAPIMPINFAINEPVNSPEPDTQTNLAPAPMVTVPSPPLMVPITSRNSSAKNLLIAIQSSETKTGVTLNLIVKNSALRFETQNLENPVRLVVDLLDVSSTKRLKKLQRFKFGNIRIGTHAEKTRVVIDFFSQALPNYQVVQNNLGLQIVFTASSLRSDTILVAPVSQNSAPISQLPEVVKKKQILKSSSPLSQKLISIDFRDAELRNVLRFMAKASGSNIVFGNNIVGRVSIQLNKVPWQDAFHAVLQVTGLNYSQTGKIIRVFTAGALDKERGFKCQVVCDQD